MPDPLPAEQKNANSRGSRTRRIAAWIAVILFGLLLTVQIGMKVWQWWTLPTDAPVIGVSYDAAWHARDGISTKNYELCLIRAGARIVELDYDSDDPTELLERIDALLLTGGGDVDPALSGSAERSVEFVDRKRDEFEIGLIRRGWGGRRLRGEVPLLRLRHQTSSEIHPAGARELRIFKEFGCWLVF